MSILVVGSFALDTVETPRERAEDVVGGSATYFSAAAAFFSPVRAVGVVGRDFPLEGIKFLEERGVDLSGLEVADGLSFRWAGRYHANMADRDTLHTDLNVFESFEPKLPEGFLETPAVFLANIAPALQMRVLDQMKKPRFSALDTMNYWIDGERDALLEVMRRVDLLIVNDTEAVQLTEEPNVVRAARRLTELGPRAAVVKKGEHGALLCHGKRLFGIPAYPLEEVRDPTGAGDTFAGGLLGYVASQGHVDDTVLRRGLVYGTVVASFCVEAFGVQRLAALTRDEIDERYREMANFVVFPESEQASA